MLNYQKQENNNNNNTRTMKKVIITVELEFADHINMDEELNEVSDNVLTSLISQVNDSEIGLVPEASETFTQTIKVRNRYNNYSTEHSF